MAKDDTAMLGEVDHLNPAVPLSEKASDTPWTFPTADEIREELYSEFTKEQKENVWTEAAEAVKTFHDDLLRRWKEEMDTLLVYAGVSSAVLTAFNVESYQLLQPANSDLSLLVLKQISAQLNSFTMTPPFVNATHPTEPVDPAQAPFQALKSAVWLNALWFSSLVFSFASATLALFVKQWIYKATVTGTSRESARLRQYRLNGLIKWRVGAVVVALPILLQLSSILFLVGLSVFLWTLHTTVAAVISVLVGSFLSVFLIVTILPVLLSDCSFRSPASLAIYSMLRLARNQWADFINVARPQFDRLGAFAYEAYDNMPTWRGRDQNEIYVHHGALCRAIVTTAYTTTADKKFLSSMPVVFSDLPPDQVAMVFADLLEFMDAEWGHYHIPEQLHYQDPVTLPLCALYGLRHMLARSEKVPGWDVDVQIIFRHFFIGDEITEQLAELACKSLCQLAVEDRKNRRLFGLAYRTLQIMYDQQGARHTYDTLSHARALYEVEMAAWDPSQGFRSFRDTTQAIFVLLHCVSATLSGQSSLTVSQTREMREWGQQQLLRTHQWLRDLEWTGLHDGCLAIPGDAASILAFPHIASHFLVQMIVNPLIALSALPGESVVVSKELVSTIELAWSSARSIYPDSVGCDAAFVWCTGMAVIEERLRKLSAVVNGL